MGDKVGDVHCCSVIILSKAEVSYEVKSKVASEVHLQLCGRQKSVPD